MRPQHLPLVAALLLLACATLAAADCMKNPFASVCRGISAKRSALGAEQAREHSQTGAAMTQQQQPRERANELADLLNKLNSLALAEANHQQQQQQLVAPPRPLAELLVRHWTDQAQTLGKAAAPWPQITHDYFYYGRQPLVSASLPAPSASSSSSSSLNLISSTGNE